MAIRSVVEIELVDGGWLRESGWRVVRSVTAESAAAGMGEWRG